MNSTLEEKQGVLFTDDFESLLEMQRSYSKICEKNSKIEIHGYYMYQLIPYDLKINNKSFDRNQL